MLGPKWDSSVSSFGRPMQVRIAKIKPNHNGSSERVVARQMRILFPF